MTYPSYKYCVVEISKFETLSSHNFWDVFNMRFEQRKFFIFDFNHSWNIKSLAYKQIEIFCEDWFYFYVLTNFNRGVDIYKKKKKNLIYNRIEN